MSDRVAVGTGPASIVEGFLDAIGRADRAAVAGALHPEVRWANVPHAAVAGREAVLDMLWSVIGRCDRVRWDVRSAAYDGSRAHLERLDRFWIGGRELAVACHGVFVTDLPSGTVRDVRDYVDLEEWRARLAATEEGAP